MRNFDENNITAAVLDRVTNAPTPRVSLRPARYACVRRRRSVSRFGCGFGVRDSLIREYVQHAPGRAPDGRVLGAPYYHLSYDFRLKSAAKMD